MLRELALENFRCFERHVVPFRSQTMVVGRNNAGKSTLVEALRLVSLATERYQNFTFRPVPDWLEDAVGARGIAPSVEGLNITAKGVFHRYGSPPARISARFEDRSEVTIFIGPDLELFITIRRADGAYINNRRDTVDLALPRVSALPPLGPLAPAERLLTPETIKRGQYTDLASLHFRNQINLWKEKHYTDFKKLVEGSWSGLRIQEFRRDINGDDTALSLLVRDEDFVAEIGEMGYGLKMWAQILWFLSRSQDADVVILDEPDVHIHPDLQERLIRIVKSSSKQSIITTHSVEMLATAKPEDVLIIDKHRRHSAFAPSVEAVQVVLDRIGTAHNLQLARLWAARRFIFIEGDDMALLQRFHEVLLPDARETLDSTPHEPLGSWDNWPYAVGSALTLRNAAGEQLTVYCILDRDWRSEEEAAERESDARTKGVQMHVWQRKEIENYLLSPSAIHRTIADGMPDQSARPTESDVRRKLEQVCEDLRQDTEDAISTKIQATERGLTAATSNQRARGRVAAAWSSLEGKVTVVSGKAALARISEWSQTSFGVALGASRIKYYLRAEDLPAELFAVVRAIHAHEPLPRRATAIPSQSRLP